MVLPVYAYCRSIYNQSAYVYDTCGLQLLPHQRGALGLRFIGLPEDPLGLLVLANLR